MIPSTSTPPPGSTGRAAPTRRAYYDERFIAPNLDTSAWFHDIGAQIDWLLLDHSSPIARDGIIAVDGKVWSEYGVLVASGAAHLLLIPG